MHLGRQDSDKNAVRVGNIDTGMHSNVKTFRQDDGKVGRENGGMPGRMEAGRENGGMPGGMEAGQENGGMPGG